MTVGNIYPFTSQHGGACRICGNRFPAGSIAAYYTTSRGRDICHFSCVRIKQRERDAYLAARRGERYDKTV
jgi:hypothetical protein